MMSKIDDSLYIDILSEIAKSIHSNYLYTLSNCNVILNHIIHQPTFVKKSLYSINNNMKRLIEGKNRNNFFETNELEWIVHGGHLEIYKQYMLMYSDYYRPLYETSKSYTTCVILRYAALGGHIHMCEYIIDLFKITNLKWALAGAAEGGHFELCKQFILSGHFINLNFALKCAAGGNHMDICNHFILLGASDFYEALNAAASEGHLEMCKHIVPLNRIGIDEALINASENGHLHICVYLISIGVTKYNTFNNAFCYAAGSGHLHICKYILSQTSFESIDLNDALYFVASSNQLESCKYILSLKSFKYADFAEPLEIADEHHGVYQYLLEQQMIYNDI